MAETLDDVREILRGDQFTSSLMISRKLAEGILRDYEVMDLDKPAESLGAASYQIRIEALRAAAVVIGGPASAHLPGGYSIEQTTLYMAEQFRAWLEEGK